MASLLRTVRGVPAKEREAAERGLREDIRALRAEQAGYASQARDRQAAGPAVYPYWPDPAGPARKGKRRLAQLASVASRAEGTCGGVLVGDCNEGLSPMEEVRVRYDEDGNLMEKERCSIRTVYKDGAPHGCAYAPSGKCSPRRKACRVVLPPPDSPEWVAAQATRWVPRNRRRTRRRSSARGRSARSASRRRRQSSRARRTTARRRRTPGSLPRRAASSRLSARRRVSRPPTM